MTLSSIGRQIGVAGLCLSAASFSIDKASGQEKPDVALTTKFDSIGLPQIPSAYVANDIFQGMRLAQVDVNFPAVPVHSVKEMTRDSNESTEAHWIATLLGFGSLALCAIGFTIFGRRSVPDESRSNHLISRIGEVFDKEPGFYPANKASLRMWVVNNGALALTGISMAAASSQISLASLYPAITCLLTVALVPLAIKYPSTSTSNIYIKACEGLSYVALGMYLAAYSFGAVTNASAVLGVPILAACAFTGLTARAFSWVPFLKDAIKEGCSPSPEKNFPSLKSLVVWSSATILSAASVMIANGTPFTSAAVVPLGYMFQNFVVLGIATVSYVSWKKKIQEK